MSADIEPSLVLFAQLVTYSKVHRMVKYNLKDAISKINNIGKVYF